MKLSIFCIHRPVFASMLSLGLVVFGLIGILRLPVRELPDIDPPIVNVSTIYPGASAEVVETQVTEPIEEALSSIEGIKTLSSESREQLSSITVQFNLTRDIDLAAQDVRDRVARARGRLPDDIDEPIVAKQDADARPSIWIALSSQRFSTQELTAIAEDYFKDPLQTVSGVSSVILGGSKRFAIRIWLDSERMAARGVTVLDVETALDEQNIELPSGRVESLEREMTIQTRGELKTPKEYDQLVIRQDGDDFIRIKDIGYAAFGVEDERTVARYNAQPAVGIGIIKQSKSNLIDVARAVQEEVDRIRVNIPAGIDIEIPYDESVYVDKAIREVWVTLALAFFLVVLTIYVFLHNLRSTIVPAITIPVSIIATFGVLYVFGFSINIITMLAFVLAIGLVVDDAIVVLENIYRLVEEGHKPFDAAVQGMKEIGFAVIATTVSLVAVFLPLAFQTSDTGRLFIEFAIALAFGVIISTIVALTLAPMISARVLKAHGTYQKEGILITFEKVLNRVSDSYAKQLNRVLHHPWLSIIVIFVCLGCAIFFYQNINKEFLPEEDKGRLFCIVIAPEGSTSEYTDRMVRKMEDILMRTPEVDGFFTAVALAQGGPGRASQGLSFIRLKKDRDKHVRDIVGGPTGLGGQFFGAIEGALVIPIIPKAIGGGFSQPFQLVLQSQDLEKLNAVAAKISQTLSQTGMLANVRSTFELNKPELRIVINRDRASVLGVSVADISRTLQILFGGSDLSRLNIKGKEYDVIVQLERESRLNPEDLQRLYVRNQQGQLVQLNNVIDYQTGGGPSAINHFNRFRSATIEATPIGVPLGEVLNKVESILEEELDPGFRYEWNGEALNLKETANEGTFVLILAILIVYMVLAAQFESLLHPLTIMMTVPLAIFGALGSLWGLGLIDQWVASLPPDHWGYGVFPRIPAMGLNLFSQIGIILLIGIVTKNGILLVDFANQRVARGMEPLAAVIEAGRIRFRPILMTATSTMAGILPIAIGFGAGAESRRPLGVAAVGGIATSTLLTLFVIPVIYVLLSRWQKKQRPLSTESKTSSAKGQPLSVLLLCGVLLTTQGCMTLGPKYEKPKMPLPKVWQDHLDAGRWKVVEPRDDWTKGQWWLIFHDEQLNRLMDMAINDNFSLKAAVQRVLKARAQARLRGVEWQPNVDAIAGAQRSRQSGTISASNAVTGVTSNRFSVGFDLSYELDLWGRLKRSAEAAAADAEVETALLEHARLMVTTELANQYFRFIELEIEADILAETETLRQSAVDLVQQRVDAGVTSELDLNRAKTELAQAKTATFQVMRDKMTRAHAIATLAGKMPSELMLESSTEEAMIPWIPVTLPSALLERRPDIAAAERRVAAANARIGVADTAFFPSVELTGLGSLESLDLDDLFKHDSRAWFLGPNLRLPFFNRKKIKAQKAIALAEYETVVAEYRNTVIEAVADVETAMSDIRWLMRQAEMQAEVVAAAEETAELSISRYKQGLVRFLEVVDSERSRLQAKLDDTRIHQERLSAAVTLIKALGGWWEPPQSDRSEGINKKE